MKTFEITYTFGTESGTLIQIMVVDAIDSIKAEHVFFELMSNAYGYKTALQHKVIKIRQVTK